MVLIGLLIMFFSVGSQVLGMALLLLIAEREEARQKKKGRSSGSSAA
jgi:hypothetical protein